MLGSPKPKTGFENYCPVLDSLTFTYSLAYAHLHRACLHHGVCINCQL